jgi:hypothetical protein
MSRSLPALVTMTAALALAGCSQGEAHAPNPTRPLDEQRAIEVIKRAVQAEGVQPSPARELPMPTGASKPFRIDVGIAGHDHCGIAYITSQDLTDLGDAIPPPNKKDERLRIRNLGSDGLTRVVLLYQDNYLYDDLAGDAHEQTTITVENELTRDVSDFVTHARASRFWDSP